MKKPLEVFDYRGFEVSKRSADSYSAQNKAVCNYVLLASTKESIQAMIDDELALKGIGLYENY
jgi:hypothetical protein